MDKRIKEEWVKRLRSGDYRQGTSALKSDGKFCCLGVLCEIAKDEGVVKSVVPMLDPEAAEPDGANLYSYDGDIYVVDEVTGDYDWETLPVSVSKWAGLDGTNPFVPDEGASLDIASINDRGEDFEYIADLIEKNF